MGGLTLDALKASGAVYPTDVLAGETALCLFAAGFGGRQDAVWLADAGLRTTCVDTDHAKLGEMVLAYPEGWEYVHGDAFEYVAQTERTWDVVSADSPTGLFDGLVETVPRLCEIARRAVIVGCGADVGIQPPGEWVISDVLHRSNYRGGVYWLVLER